MSLSKLPRPVRVVALGWRLAFEASQKSLTDVASETGVLRTSISRWLNGTRNPSPVAGDKVARALGLTALDVLRLGERAVAEAERTQARKALERLATEPVLESVLAVTDTLPVEDLRTLRARIDELLGE